MYLVLKEWSGRDKISKATWEWAYFKPYMVNKARSETKSEGKSEIEEAAKTVVELEADAM